MLFRYHVALFTNPFLLQYSNNKRYYTTLYQSQEWSNDVNSRKVIDPFIYNQISSIVENLIADMVTID